MKWHIIPLFILFSWSALAASAPAPRPLKPLQQQQNPTNIEVINGKRFYSLQNVHRFTGSTNNPRALSVMHAPRPQRPMTRSRFSVPLAPTPTTGTTPPATGTSDKVLSIFAPEDKGAATK